MANIYTFGAGKGGTGKTTSALCVYLVKKAASIDVAVRDGDSTNPDLARALGLGAESIFNPDELGDWSQILELAKKTDVIVNLPAGGDRVFLANAQAIAEAAAVDGNQVHYLAVINRSRECLVLLKTALDQILGSGVIPHVVINTFFGEASAFGRFNSSKSREAVAEAGGSEIVLHELKDFIVDALMSPSGRDLEKAPPLSKTLYQTWLRKTAETITI